MGCDSRESYEEEVVVEGSASASISSLKSDSAAEAVKRKTLIQRQMSWGVEGIVMIFLRGERMVRMNE